jgi:hypothetical protein
MPWLQSFTNRSECIALRGMIERGVLSRWKDIPYSLSSHPLCVLPTHRLHIYGTLLRVGGQNPINVTKNVLFWFSGPHRLNRNYIYPYINAEGMRVSNLACCELIFTLEVLPINPNQYFWVHIFSKEYYRLIFASIGGHSTIYKRNMRGISLPFADFVCEVYKHLW